jgi:PPOX class probable F420-dependent enzyme
VASPDDEEDPVRSGLGPDDLPDLMRGDDLGILATRRPDDSIMLSPVWWEWRDGAFLIWAEDETDRKVRHIQRDPRVTFLVPNQHRPYQGYEIRGTATLSFDEGLFYDVLRRTTERWDGSEKAEAWASTYPPGVVIRVEPGVERGWEID